MGTLRQGEIQRLDAASSAVSTGRIPIVQNDELVTVTVNEIATGARAVDGPASSTDEAFARFDSTTGLLLQDSTSTMDNSGNAAFAGTITQVTGKTDYNKFLGVDSVIVSTVGTWTATRGAQALVFLRHTAADNTSVLAIDITEELRAAASKGFQLNTMDVIFENATADLDAHSATLDRVTYADSTTEAVTSMPITGTLGVGQDADPQVDRLTVTTPAFEVTALTKVVLEITVDAATTSAYDYIGTVLNFTRNDL
ncbi:MAG: hypothetical protein V3T88_06270 [Nitrosomonadaceae bacterium]